MNSFFNMSMIGNQNPFQNPYQVPPPNFIETFFRFVMENGSSSMIGFAVLFVQLYLYMSLSHIQGLFKYLNDKIALYCKAKLEQYFIAVMHMFSQIWNFIYNVITSWLVWSFAIPIKIVKWTGLHNLPSKIYNWFFKKTIVSIPVNNPIPVLHKQVLNKHVMKLDPTNAVDMNALGHYILSNKRTLALEPIVDRTFSAKKTTVEGIAIPENLVLALQGDIVVQLSHHISLKYEFETDHVNEKIKKYTCDKLPSAEDKTKKTGNKPAQLKEALKKLWGDKNIYSDDPRFWYKKCEWSCDPESMTNTEYTILWRVLYYNGDVNVIRKFIQYLLGEDSFKFDDKVYEKSDEAIQGDFKDVFKVSANLEGYLSEVPDYHMQFVSNLEEQGVKSMIDELSKKFFSRYQGAKGDSNSRISITFASPTLQRFQLAKYGRLWYAKLINQFYDQTTKKNGEKITIYKLGIVYDTKVEDKPNPKYIQWEKEQAEELRRKQEEQAQQIQAIQIQQQLEKDKQQLAAQALQLQQQQQIQQQQLLLQQQMQQLQQGIVLGTTTTSAVETAGSVGTVAAEVLPTSENATNVAAATSPVAAPVAAQVLTPLPVPAPVAPVLTEDKNDADGKEGRDGRDSRDKKNRDEKNRDDKNRDERSRSRDRSRKSRRSNRRKERRYDSSDSSSSSDDDDYSALAANLSGFDLFEADFEGGYGRHAYNSHGMGNHNMNQGGFKKGKGKGKKGWKNFNNNREYWGSYENSAVKQPPTKTIKVEHKTPSAYAKVIKTDRKPLEYLYLPEQSMEALVEYLRNFKDHRDRFQTFGFPYRGGIILSGAPGCGKSSTILATATYLQKDIYYLDLGQIKTNHELKLCVDYIRTNSSNGGVIIFEDIDCMNDIVHRRSDLATDMTSETSITKITEEVQGPLSLAYLLNVLDGTMAPEDVIFIMTTNHIEKLDKALIRPGRIDLDIELTKCTRVQLQKIYLDLYNKELPQDILDRFPEKHWITARVILHLFHNSFDSNIDPEVLIAPLLNTDDDELEMYATD